MTQSTISHNTDAMQPDIRQESMKEAFASIVSDLKRWPAQAWLLSAMILLLYIPVIAETLPYWLDNGTYSFCALIIPISLGLLFLMRHDLRGIERNPSLTGIWWIAAGVLIEQLGWFTHIRFLAVGSLPLVLIGAILVMHGPKMLRVIRFPILFLVFAAPFPEPILTKVDVEAQFISTISTEHIMQFFGFAIVRQGSVLQVPTMSLNVAEACSGFKKMTSFFCFAVLYGWVFRMQISKWLALICLSMPLAMIANIVRICGLVAIASWYGPRPEAIAHEYADYFVIALSSVLLVWAGGKLGCEKTRFTQ